MLHLSRRKLTERSYGDELMPAFVLILVMCLGLSVHSAQASENDSNAAFADFAGETVLMKPDIVKQLLNDSEHTPLLIDSNGDGKVDRKYFIDTDERHGDRCQPLVVMVIDEDGDMGSSGITDLDSDCYVADWHGDGTIDRIVDYNDLDGDNDVDEQYLYQWTENEHLKNRMPKKVSDKAYLVAWAKDYGDDNRLWYHTNYEYGQHITQWKTDFNGDEMFVYLFFFDREEQKLIPIWENAFSFYDLDDDTFSEEVVRFSGSGINAENLRYSMDLDNDSEKDNVHDFDFSLSCIGPVSFGESDSERVMIRGRVTEPILRWDRMRQISKEARWNQIHLTWDENDCNVDPLPGRLHNERWEGVISHDNEYIPRVGGPSCGPYNKRNEVDTDASGGMQMYFSPVDARLHLFGAESGWIAVDYDYDTIPDMRIEMEDRDGNGYFDLWRYDTDADNSDERIVKCESDVKELLPFDYNELQKYHTPSVQKSVDESERMIRAMKHLLSDAGQDGDNIETYYYNELAAYDPDFALGKKMLASVESRRYYYDLIRERYWGAVSDRFNVRKWFENCRKAYDCGDIALAAEILENVAK